MLDVNNRRGRRINKYELDGTTSHDIRTVAGKAGADSLIQALITLITMRKMTSNTTTIIAAGLHNTVNQNPSNLSNKLIKNNLSIP
mmetsp:Transcript_7532/g.11267  ORF Transcript_7532/g.11267 Transcript_7532/m.11267 type:complete len:86 (+) Transcript_7532:190-447(+)